MLSQFECPAVKSFPIGVPIPVSLVIKTTAKTKAKSKAPEPPAFPPLPPGDAIRLRLYYQVDLKANGSKSTIRRVIPLSTCSAAGTPEPARATTIDLICNHGDAGPVPKLARRCWSAAPQRLRQYAGCHFA
jgi:hypothetical protein